MHFRASKKFAQDVSLSEPIDTDKEGHPLTLLDVLADEGDLSDRVDIKLNGRKLPGYMKEVLSPREQEILRMRYGFGTTRPLAQREVARHLKISRSYVSRIEKKALEKLRDRFEKTTP